MLLLVHVLNALSKLVDHDIRLYANGWFIAVLDFAYFESYDKWYVYGYSKK